MNPKYSSFQKYLINFAHSSFFTYNTFSSNNVYPDHIMHPVNAFNEMQAHLGIVALHIARLSTSRQCMKAITQSMCAKWILLWHGWGFFEGNPQRYFGYSSGRSRCLSYVYGINRVKSHQFDWWAKIYFVLALTEFMILKVQQQ